MLKALHEAKVHSSWINPDPDYDKAIQEFVRLILNEDVNGAFLNDFRSFERRVSHLGLFNSLSQSLLKLASPGVPDTYQGSELWDFRLVDPDNRRPVDYPKRAEMLQQLQSATAASNGAMTGLCRDLIATKEDGRVKLYVHFRTLDLRRERPGLLSNGAYIPVACEGTHADRVFAFVRQSGDTSVLVAVPRLLGGLIPDANQTPLGDTVWRDTRLVLPAEVSSRDWRNILTGEDVTATAQDGRLSVALAQVFAHFPVALLVSEAEV
jgi:(1->4)-alpha-D-glucan 1-alpha-D-glucosylmutase